MARLLSRGTKTYTYNPTTDTYIEDGAGTGPGDGVTTDRTWIDDSQQDDLFSAGDTLADGSVYLGTVTVEMEGGTFVALPVFTVPNEDGAIAVHTHLPPTDASFRFAAVLEPGDIPDQPFQALSGPSPFDDDFTGIGGREEVYLLTGDDIFHARGGNDLVYGGYGEDLISGDGGADRLFGGADGDSLHGGAKGDRLYGGDGDDVLLGRKGGDQIEGGDGRDVMRGGADEDRLYGGNGRDRLYGGSSEDRLEGGSSNDRLAGGAGADRLEGGEGDDRVRGGAGDDEIHADAGDDVLFGGEGQDIFHFFAAGGRDLGIDRIEDFDVAGDMLRITLDDPTDYGFQTILGDTHIAFEGGRIILVDLLVAEEDLNVTFV